MIKFIQGEPEKDAFKFGQVKEDQFFVSKDGLLCQKVNSSRYTVIAAKDGKPYSNYIDGAHSGLEIKRILPHITKIEF